MRSLRSFRSVGTIQRNVHSAVASVSGSGNKLAVALSSIDVFVAPDRDVFLLYLTARRRVFSSEYYM